ncbi:hypothetical protein C8Q73DRAFT_288416 [Cubamyces lactineus]|nr:hypothetical protein C8Q73DRAFT_288416 [Cubamyces lactineus]
MKTLSQDGDHIALWLISADDFAFPVRVRSMARITTPPSKIPAPILISPATCSPGTHPPRVSPLLPFRHPRILPGTHHCQARSWDRRGSSWSVMLSVRFDCSLESGPHPWRMLLHVFRHAPLNRLSIIPSTNVFLNMWRSLLRQFSSISASGRPQAAPMATPVIVCMHLFPRWKPCRR